MHCVACAERIKKMAIAQAKYIRMSPRKVRRVVNEIRGKDTKTAQTILKFMPYAAAKVVAKVLKSAVSNAKENESLDPTTLLVTQAFVDQGITLKRWRPMSKGRGYPILKRTSNVTIEVKEDPKAEKKIVSAKASKIESKTKVEKEVEPEIKSEVKPKKSTSKGKTKKSKKDKE